MSYTNPEDGSPTYVVQFFHTDKEKNNLINFVKEQFEKKDNKVENGIHQGNDDTTRKSSVIWFKDPVISNIISTSAHIANNETGWKFKLTGHETMQMTRYKEGEEYGWHLDGDATHFGARSFDFAGERSLLKTSDASLLGTIRKLSVSVVVNDDYEGGHFETMHLKDGKVVKKKVAAKAGSAIVFPATLTHRVTPITKGIRYSLVVWFAGPPFV
tara:strand:- start:741 stop:1382 length:642 start_codon:yes stop_codon:yes gene_type:complete